MESKHKALAISAIWIMSGVVSLIIDDPIPMAMALLASVLLVVYA